MSAEGPIYGVVGEFAEAAQLLRAVDAVRRRGFDDVEAYVPFDVDGLADALATRPRRMAPVALVAGGLVAVGTYVLQWYSAVIDYPINSGGRPLDSWPAFVPASFDLGVLGSAIAMLVMLFWCAKLPQLRHPLFDARGFARATRDRYVLVVRPSRPTFDPASVAAFLQDLGAARIDVVDR